jgi:hypothetical protein
MLPKILRTQHGVPVDLANGCAEFISINGKFVDLNRDIGGSLHVLLDSEVSQLAATEDGKELITNGDAAPLFEVRAEIPAPPIAQPQRGTNSRGPKPIFVGHGKNKAPLQQPQRLLTTFQIPHKVVIDEANLGRPMVARSRRKLKRPSKNVDRRY